MNAAFDELFDADVAGERPRRPSHETAFAGAAGRPRRWRRRATAARSRASLVDEVRAVPGVAVAAGDVQGYAQIVDPATERARSAASGPPTIGMNWNRAVRRGPRRSARADRPTGRRPGGDRRRRRRGERPRASGQTVHDPVPGAARGVRDRRDRRVRRGRQPRRGHAGRLRHRDRAAGPRQEGVFDTITVEADEGADVSERSRRRSSRCCRTASRSSRAATSPTSRRRTLQEGLGFFRTALLVFAAIALFVGAFIIFNTFSIIVAQRTRELALLRTLGASRRQVMTSVVVEAVDRRRDRVGRSGSSSGSGSRSASRALLAAFGIDLPSTSTQLQLRTVVVVVRSSAWASPWSPSIVPARHAARVAPIQALRRGRPCRRRGQTRRRALVGRRGGRARHRRARRRAVRFDRERCPAGRARGAALTFIGVAVLSPLVARPVAGAIGRPFRGPAWPGKLGRANAMRNPRRTASTASALMIGLGLVAMVAILAASLKASFDVGARADAPKADLTLSTTSFTPFSTDVATQVAALAEVGAVASSGRTGSGSTGRTAFLTALDPATFDAGGERSSVTEGSLADLGRRHGRRLRREVAEDNGWTLGDEVQPAFATDGRLGRCAIVAIYEENADRGQLRDRPRHLRGALHRAAGRVRAGEGRRRDPIERPASGRRRRPRRGLPEHRRAGPGGVPREAGRVHRPVLLGLSRRS